MNDQHDSTDEWNRLIADLRRYRSLHRETWGDVDDVLLARFLAGTCTDEEHLTVRQVRNTYPAVDRLLDKLRDAIAAPDTLESDLAVPKASPATSSLWQSGANDRTLADRLGAWIGQSGTVLSEGLSGLQVDFQPAYAQAMGPADQDNVESRIAWNIPLPDHQGMLAISIWPTGDPDQWNLVCLLENLNDQTASTDVRGELRDADGELDVSFRLADTRKEPVYVSTGNWTLLVYVDQRPWRIPLRLGPAESGDHGVTQP